MNVIIKIVQCICVVMVLAVLITECSNEQPPPPCNSDIYCYGRLLDVIQMAKLFEDSKTFVDMKMKYNRNETLRNFDLFMKEKNDAPKQKDVRKFLMDNFEREGQEFEQWVPNDWTQKPTFLSNIQDPLLKQWGSNLNAIWKELGRKLKPDIESHQQQYSIMWVPNPVIVPGGRFREFYYWDSYWIIQGLLISEMYHTVRGMLDNFLFIVDTYGHIPNGGRIYYLQRSQPPFLIPMVKLYVDAVKDSRYIADNIETMEAEFMYWLTNHSKSIQLNGKTYTLAAYGDNSYGPRPESYFEDIVAARYFPEEVQRQKFYSELKAAAESGWDFSSRWFISNGTNKGNLTNLNTRSIIPTDLNAFIYWNAVILAEFHERLGNSDKVRKYTEIADQWNEAVTAVLWHEDIGAWLDYDIMNSVRRNYFYPTNLVPLFTDCYPKEQKDKFVKLVLKYLQGMDVIYHGGVPTTKERTGEQWDFPNAWPPLQHMLVIGLYKTGNEAAERLAYEISEKWILSNYRAYNATEAMYEKYDATRSGGFGGGGEYEVQKGFGWTNGVVLDFLYRFGDTLRIDNFVPLDNEIVPELQIPLASSTPVYSQVATGLLISMVSLTAGFIGLRVYRKYIRGRRFDEDFLKTGLSPETRYTELRNIPKSMR